jgi:hypothetical protein
MKKLLYLVMAVVLIAIGTIAACSRTVGSAQDARHTGIGERLVGSEILTSAGRVVR